MPASMSHIKGSQAAPLLQNSLRDMLKLVDTQREWLREMQARLTITDDMVEAAAKSIHEEYAREKKFTAYKWEDVGITARRLRLREARAALTAVLSPTQSESKT